MKTLHIRLLILLAVVLTVGTTRVALGDTPKPGAPVDAPSKASAATDTSSDLAHKNIQGSFDPQLENYGYLRNIGKTIDEARDKRDAETLAMMAMLLFRAEKESARKCPDVGAQELLEEATSLAEVQKNPAVMSLIADLWGDDAVGPGDETRRKTLSEKAKQFAQARDSAKHSACRLVIRNLSSHNVNLYADNQFLGSIDPYDTRYIYVDAGATELYARATCHPVEWGPNKYKLGSEFTWRLTP